MPLCIWKMLAWHNSIYNIDFSLAKSTAKIIQAIVGPRKRSAAGRYATCYRLVTFTQRNYT
jgi:hypothetical protein